MGEAFSVNGVTSSVAEGFNPVNVAPFGNSGGCFGRSENLRRTAMPVGFSRVMVSVLLTHGGTFNPSEPIGALFQRVFILEVRGEHQPG
jgi:hypothetical protein